MIRKTITVMINMISNVIFVRGSSEKFDGKSVGEKTEA